MTICINLNSANQDELKDIKTFLKTIPLQEVKQLDGCGILDFSLYAITVMWEGQLPNALKVLTDKNTAEIAPVYRALKDASTAINVATKKYADDERIKLYSQFKDAPRYELNLALSARDFDTEARLQPHIVALQKEYDTLNKQVHNGHQPMHPNKYMEALGVSSRFPNL
jgi:uncharacterized protein YukE